MCIIPMYVNKLYIHMYIYVYIHVYILHLAILQADQRLVWCILYLTEHKNIVLLYLKYVHTRIIRVVYTVYP